MGKAPREPLLKAVDLLTKILQNVLKAPEEPKYRSLRAANEKIATALDVSGVLSLLAFAGFEQSFADGEAKLILNQGAPLTPVEGAASQLKRLDALLKGLPLNGPQDVAHVTATTAAHEESSHRCSACGKASIMIFVASSEAMARWRLADQSMGWRRRVPVSLQQLQRRFVLLMLRSLEGG